MRDASANSAPTWAMDFDQLSTFVEVAALGNFSRAAEKVLRSQPAVSAQIRQLEQEYGEKLFDRTKKSVRLTPAGELFLEYVQRMLALRDESLRAIADSGKVTRGVLSIGANETTFLYVLPELLSQYHRRHPKVRISVYRNFSHKVLEKVEDGAIQMGVVTIPVKSPSLEVIPLFRDPLIWIADPEHPLASKKKIKLAELAEQELILHKVGSLRRLMEKQLRPFRPQLRVTMELTSTEMVKKFVAAGLGISLISEKFAEEDIRENKLVPLHVEAEPAWRELGLVFHREHSLSHAAEAFIALAREEHAIGTAS
ncbi:MAG TPA: LysR family transcriptional regulator [Terriglobales bacterium]|nr:LysR family transcriptional regulator [Terriglobales bacterium]